MKFSYMHKYYRPLFFVLVLLSIENIQAQTLQQSPGTNSIEKFAYKVIDAPANTFGYDVYGDGKLIIHQTSIPAMSGNKGFATKADAVKVAELVIEKIRKGIMPPTVSKDELQKLKVIP